MVTQVKPSVVKMVGIKEWGFYHLSVLLEPSFKAVVKKNNGIPRAVRADVQLANVLASLNVLPGEFQLTERRLNEEAMQYYMLIYTGLSMEEILKALQHLEPEILFEYIDQNTN